MGLVRCRSSISERDLSVNKVTSVYLSPTDHYPDRDSDPNIPTCLPNFDQEHLTLGSIGLPSTIRLIGFHSKSCLGSTYKS